MQYGSIDIPQLLRSIKSVSKLLLEPDEDPDEVLLQVSNNEQAMLTSFMLARQMMYSLVYQHPVCKVYDMHLEDFVLANLGAGRKIATMESLMNHSDSYIMELLYAAAQDPQADGNIHARRLLQRKHFHCLKKIGFKEVRELQTGLTKFRRGDTEDLMELPRSVFIEQKNMDAAIKALNIELSVSDPSDFVVRIQYQPDPPVNMKDEDDLTGYAKILDYLRRGNFGYCYFYVERSREQEVKNLIKKLINLDT